MTLNLNRILLLFFLIVVGIAITLNVTKETTDQVIIPDIRLELPDFDTYRTMINQNVTLMPNPSIPTYVEESFGIHDYQITDETFSASLSSLSDYIMRADEIHDEGEFDIFGGFDSWDQILNYWQMLTHEMLKKVQRREQLNFWDQLKLQALMMSVQTVIIDIEFHKGQEGFFQDIPAAYLPFIKSIRDGLQLISDYQTGKLN